MPIGTITPGLPVTVTPDVTPAAYTSLTAPSPTMRIDASGLQNLSLATLNVQQHAADALASVNTALTDRLNRARVLVTWTNVYIPSGSGVLASGSNYISVTPSATYTLNAGDLVTLTASIWASPEASADAGTVAVGYSSDNTNWTAINTAFYYDSPDPFGTRPAKPTALIGTVGTATSGADVEVTAGVPYYFAVIAKKDAGTGVRALTGTRMIVQVFGIGS